MSTWEFKVGKLYINLDKTNVIVVTGFEHHRNDSYINYLYLNRTDKEQSMNIVFMRPMFTEITSCEQMK